MNILLINVFDSEHRTANVKELPIKGFLPEGTNDRHV